VGDACGAWVTWVEAAAAAVCSASLHPLLLAASVHAAICASPDFQLGSFLQGARALFCIVHKRRNNTVLLLLLPGGRLRAEQEQSTPQ